MIVATDNWRVANIKDIEQSTVGDLLEVFLNTGVTHVPVMEATDSNELRLRGLFSFAKVKRLLADMAGTIGQTQLKKAG